MRREYPAEGDRVGEWLAPGAPQGDHKEKKVKKARRLRGEKGFTLIELLVVMAILGVLATMVFPTVTGMKTGGEGAAGKADAKEVENAINNYNTADTGANPWPESSIGCLTGTGGADYNIVIADSTRAGDPYTKTVLVGANAVGAALTPAITDTAAVGLSGSCSSTLASHTQVNWDATAKARQKDGSVQNMTFVPNYLASQPKSSLNVRGSDVATAPSEFIWLLKYGTALDGQAGRSLQVLRLDAAGTTYLPVKN